MKFAGLLTEFFPGSASGLSSHAVITCIAFWNHNKSLCQETLWVDQAPDYLGVDVCFACHLQSVLSVTLTWESSMLDLCDAHQWVAIYMWFHTTTRHGRPVYVGWFPGGCGVWGVMFSISKLEKNCLENITPPHPTPPLWSTWFGERIPPWRTWLGE